MSALDEPRLGVVELGALLEAVDPAALLVAPRLLRRIIKYDRKLTHLGLQVPHRKSYVIGRDTLLALAARDELGVKAQRELPATLLLLAQPDADDEETRGETLVTYWRLLFHGRVHLAFERRFQESRLSKGVIHQRIHQIGKTEFDQIRLVLRQENYLLPPHDDRTVYEEFAALYLELRFFAASLVSRYFPTIEDFGRIDQVLAQDVDGPALFAATRPAGAPDPVMAADEPDPAPEPSTPTTLPWTGSDKPYRDLMTRADRAAAAGNVVRAAIRRTQAARVAPATLAADAQERALADLDRLALRLQQALHQSDAHAEKWRRALPALLSPAATGIWPTEARLLYDLQKVCIDHERPIYAPDLVEWACCWFRQPLVRPLPNQPLVLAVKHLRGAVARLPLVRIAETQNQALSALLHDDLHHAEVRLREKFRPVLRDALVRVGLGPHNFPERLGEQKLIEELLDRITERGFLNVSDLRDALARNQLKLDDLSGPFELLMGDPLIRANRELAVGAAGVYRRGEFYLRWLQRGSALAFGTHLGRMFMLWFALPFIGAVATIVFVQEMLHLLQLSHAPAPEEDAVGVSLAAFAVTTGALGIFYLLLMHWPAFRRLVLRSLELSWHALRAVLIDMPVAFFHLPAVRWLLDSRSYLLLVRYVVKPLPVAVVTWALLEMAGAHDVSAAAAVATFLLACLLINSRLGRDIEEAVIDGAVRNWAYFRGLVPGLVRFVMNLFKTILETIDRALYTVDEWLRFRGGEGRFSLVAKICLGFIWFFVTYVFRLFVNVFIEPTVNPIKHFPAVTVAAKLLVPLWPVLIPLFAAPFEFLGRPLAFLMSNVILHSLPGAAGFLVWEFKENWRLYRTNRPRVLRPEVIGHHGETLLRLMRPGFHSGTLPKLYAKLRRAERRAYRGGSGTSARRLRESLHHVEESIGHFAQRELLAFLGASKGWTAGPVHLAAVDAGSNRIRLELACPALSVDHFDLNFEEQSGWLLAHVDRPGWLTRLSGEQASVFTAALLGFYQKAGVDLVREQIQANFAPACPPYDINDEGLIVWPGPGYETEVIYDLREEPILHPRLKEGRPDQLLDLAADKLLFTKQPITWQAWVAAWERDQSGAGNPHLLLPRVPVLPAFEGGHSGDKKLASPALPEHNGL